MWQFISFVRDLFAGTRSRSGIVEYYDHRLSAPAVDRLAVLMVTHRWTTS